MSIERRRLLPLPLLLAFLAGCGEDAQDEHLAAFEAKMRGAGQCMAVHGAVIGIGINPLTVAQDHDGAAGEVLAAMREQTDMLPAPDPDEPDLREVHRGLVDRIAGIRGRGLDAAEELAESPQFHADAAVLTGWYAAHCRGGENADRATGGSEADA